ncbi:hypothetical protein COV13_04520 [Candidatus Woesearchaeota archaeon CG10_big_fil_rev_8_21_14_0_10_32_9]|nr:MAG: hypothetical protein COV13_04520 [Candidatus Woesearchaeota archaeon CG10_big_fil_rev_8_21_14_0_10_32_9]
MFENYLLNCASDNKKVSDMGGSPCDKSLENTNFEINPFDQLKDNNKNGFLYVLDQENGGFKIVPLNNGITVQESYKK